MLTLWKFFNLFLNMRGLEVELELHVIMWASALLWANSTELGRAGVGAGPQAGHTVTAPGRLGRGSSQGQPLAWHHALACAQEHISDVTENAWHIFFFFLSFALFFFFPSEIISFWVCEFTTAITNVCLHVCTREAQGAPSVWQGCCGKTN